MFDIRNNQHVEDKSILFIEEDRIETGVAGILQQSFSDDRDVVHILNGEMTEYLVIDIAEDAEYLVKALQKALAEEWWQA